MSISERDILDCIIRPATRLIDAQSASSDILLLGTCKLESNFGKYLVQIKGPAKGIFQMEPFTHDSLIKHELKKTTVRKIMHACRLESVSQMTSDMLVWNLYYAAMMARAKYMTKPMKLPDCDDYKGLAAYYKLHYNTPLGACTIEKAESVFNKLISDFG